MTHKARQEWLKLCFDKWTTSGVQSDAWKYRNDFAGFCKWFLREPEPPEPPEPPDGERKIAA